MKICFLGNMNNMPLTYARELRSMGHEVHLYVDGRRNEPLHRPEYRYPEYTSYPEWMFDVAIKVPLLYYTFPRVFLSGLISAIEANRYDGIVLSGLSVSLAGKLGAPKFALLAGSDLDVLCDPHNADLTALVGQYGLVSGTARYALLRRFVPRQRAGLRRCLGFNYFPEGINPHAEELLDDIYRGHAPYRLQIRGTDCRQLPLAPPSNRRGNDVVILVAVRFLWREPLPANFAAQENKRNDLIVRGLAQFMAQTGRRPRIVFVAKGPDVAATKELAASLGIADAIEWLAEMPLAELFEWYRRADIAFDQLGLHILGAVGLDCMLSGKPVIANGRPDVFRRILPEESPVCQASSANEVASWLKVLVDNPERRAEIGRRSRDYVMRYFNLTDTAAAIASYFASLQSDHRSNSRQLENGAGV